MPPTLMRAMVKSTTTITRLTRKAGTSSSSNSSSLTRLITSPEGSEWQEINLLQSTKGLEATGIGKNGGRSLKGEIHGKFINNKIIYYNN